MTHYASYTDLGRQLQSRVKLRGNRIASYEMWRVGYRQLGRMKDFRAVNEALEIHRREQHLDKALLKIVQQLAYYEANPLAEF